ncbi:MAG: GNAT family N-acetyltransferase, partial [Xanthomonadales bacterium]|nr:GNAT family N-acetyltransferase [Xanthomonadales bacterium]
MFRPASVALIGASDQPDSLGMPITRHLLDQAAQVDVHLVNPRRPMVFGRHCLDSVADLPLGVDLAVLLTPWPVTLDLLEALDARAVGCAVIIALCGRPNLSLRAFDADRRRLQRFTATHAMRIVGPASQGIILPRLALNLSLCPATPEAGNVAFVSSSGAIASVIADWAENRGLGMSALISLGDRSDVDLPDALDYLAADAHTRAVLIYLEDFEQPRRLLGALRNLALRKPTVMLAPAVDTQGQAPGSEAAGRAPLFRLALQRAGVLLVDSLDEFCAAANVDLPTWPHAGSRFALVGNGTGLPHLAANAVHRVGGQLAPLSRSTQAQLRELLPADLSVANPLDVGREADGQRYAAAARILAADDTVDVVLLNHHPTSFAASAQIVASLAPSPPEDAPLLAAFAGAGQDRSRYNLARRGIAAFETPEAAVHAYALNRRHHLQRSELLRARPPLARHLRIDVARAHRLLRSAAPIEPIALLACADITLHPAEARNGRTLLWHSDAVLGPLLRADNGTLARHWLLPLDSLSATEALRWLDHPALEPPPRHYSELLALSELYQRCQALDTLSVRDPHWSDDGWLAAEVSYNLRSTARLPTAFSPCPAEPDEWIEAEGLPQLLLRPIRAEDEVALQQSFGRLTPEEVRLRFLYPLSQLGHDMAARLTQLDYDREVALVLTDAAPPGMAPIHAVARASFDLPTATAEFAIIVQREFAGHGLGRFLMERIIEHCRRAGMREVYGLVLPENRAMLTLAERLGFTRSRAEELLRVSLPLTAG